MICVSNRNYLYQQLMLYLSLEEISCLPQFEYIEELLIHVKIPLSAEVAYLQGLSLK